MCRSVEKELRVLLDVAKSIVGLLLFFGVGIIQWLFNRLYLCHQGIAPVGNTKKLQWNPVNMVINGPKSFAVLMGWPY